MKKSDALKRWCPLTRVKADDGAWNRHPAYAVHAEARCIADQCMMWQQIPAAEEKGHCGLATVAK